MSTRIQGTSGGMLVSCTMAVLLLAACASTTAVTPRANPTLEKIETGVYAAPADAPDLLLHLKSQRDARVLVIPAEFANISDAHVAALRDWVAEGGTVWLQGPGLKNPSLRALVPIQSQPFDFHKTSGEKGGELVVRDSVDRLQIREHPLTEGVRQLYVYPQTRFDGTPEMTPLLEMTDNEGVHGTVIGVVPVGQGQVILDGTARAGGGFFARIPGFDPNHPNSVQEGADWNSYDWDRLVANARDLSDAALNDQRGTSGS